MTFQDLLKMHENLVEKASVEPYTTDTEEGPAFQELVEAVSKTLSNELQGTVLEKGARMAAYELISLFTLPEGHGAALDMGSYGGWSETDFLDPTEAEVEAPSLEIEIRKPPKV